MYANLLLLILRKILHNQIRADDLECYIALHDGFGDMFTKTSSLYLLMVYVNQ